MRLQLDRLRRFRPRARDEDTTEIVLQEPAPETSKPPAPWREILSPRSPAGVYAGVVLIAAGLGLAAYTWSKVAGLLAVPLQLPYLASGGLTAIGLVVLGATLTALATSRREAARREERLDELVAALRAISEHLAEEDR